MRRGDAVEVRSRAASAASIAIRQARSSSTSSCSAGIPSRRGTPAGRTSGSAQAITSADVDRDQLQRTRARASAETRPVGVHPDEAALLEVGAVLVAGRAVLGEAAEQRVAALDPALHQALGAAAGGRVVAPGELHHAPGPSASGGRPGSARAARRSRSARSGDPAGLGVAGAAVSTGRVAELGAAAASRRTGRAYAASWRARTGGSCARLVDFGDARARVGWRARARRAAAWASRASSVSARACSVLRPAYLHGLLARRGLPRALAIVRMYHARRRREARPSAATTWACASPARCVGGRGRC